jgi:tetratricopeptide (TPR) repeat protein
MRFEGLDELRALLKAMPPLEVHHKLSPEGGEAGPLVPDAALIRLEREWADVFPAEEPMLTSFVANEAAWDASDTWLRWLRDHPLAWQSFRVLDELAAAAAGVVVPIPTLLSLQMPLLLRGEALLRETVARNQAEGLPLAWGWHENRPALRLVVALATSLGRSGEHDREREVLEWLVNILNPHDNHGMRAVLMESYLKSGHVDAALALAARFPDDGLAAMHFDTALALFMAGRKQEAADALQSADESFPEVLPMLRPPRARKPKLDPQWVTAGGRDEAWFYRESRRSLWEGSGALEWVKGATTAARRRT